MTTPQTTIDPRMPGWIREMRLWISEKVDFSCDCRAYQESDTGAWIHEENTCAAFMEDHIDIVLTDVERILVGVGADVGRLRATTTKLREALETIATFCDSPDWEHGYWSDESGGHLTCEGRGHVRELAEEALK